VKTRVKTVFLPKMEPRQNTQGFTLNPTHSAASLAGGHPAARAA
jgi:hypothetical protein